MTDINRLKSLMEKATPRPWTTSLCNCGSPHCKRTQFSNGIFYQGTGFEPEDADLIAEALDALPFLLAQSERTEALEAELAGVKEESAAFKARVADKMEQLINCGCDLCKSRARALTTNGGA